MSAEKLFRMRARWLLNGQGPALQHVLLTLRNGRILDVAEGEYSGACDLDLTDSILCPCFVNAHAHLELSYHAAPLGRGNMPLPEWLQLVIASRGNLIPNVPAPSACSISGEKDSQGRSPASLREESRSLPEIRSAASSSSPHEIDTWDSAESVYRNAVNECLSAGVSTVVDIVQASWQASWLEKSPLSVVGLRELRGFSPVRAPSIQAEASEFFSTMSNLVADAPAQNLGHAQNALGGGSGEALPKFGLSPHAPYSISLEALHALTGAFPQSLFAMHIAESREELEFLATGEGPFRALLEELGAWDASGWRTPRTIRDYLAPLSKARRALVIHGNFLDGDAIQFLSNNRERMAVVYCPRTHQYFGHPPYPLRALRKAGVRVLLGTDSRASSPDLSMLAEIRAASERMAPQEALEACTTMASQALGKTQTSAGLLAGQAADLVVLGPIPGRESSPWDLLMDEQVKVQGALIGGIWHMLGEKNP